MKVFISLLTLLFSFSLSAQSDIYQADIFSTDEGKHTLEMGIKLKVRNLEPFEEQELMVMVHAQAQSDQITEGMFCMYTSRLLQDHIRNVVQKLGKSFIFYQYTNLNKEELDHMINIRILEGAQYLVSVTNGEEEIIVAESDRLLYFDY